MLIVFASIAVLGVTSFIVQRLKDSDSDRISAQAIYDAQAGLHNALYFFRFHKLSANGYFTLGQTNIDSDDFFVLGATDAGLLMVNTSVSALQSSNTRIGAWLIQNATNSRQINIASMTVSWSGVGSGPKLQYIYLNNQKKWPSGSSTGNNASGLTEVLSSYFNLDTTPTIYSNNTLRFSSSMSGATVKVTFTMSDNSTQTLTIFQTPAPQPQNNSFTVKSMGKTTGSNIYRSIQATYNALNAHVTDYDEINTTVP